MTEKFVSQISSVYKNDCLENMLFFLPGVVLFNHFKLFQAFQNIASNR